MNPRKTSPTEGLVGIAMHVLFVFFILLCRVAAGCLDILGDHGPRGGHKYCRACGRKTARIRPQEYLRQGKIHPQCPRCGGKVEPHPPILTSKLAVRLLRKESDWDACSIRLLRRVAGTSPASMKKVAQPKNKSKPCEDAHQDRTGTSTRVSPQTMLQKSHTNIQESPSRCLGRFDRPDPTHVNASSFLLGDGINNQSDDGTDSPADCRENSPANQTEAQDGIMERRSGGVVENDEQRKGCSGDGEHFGVFHDDGSSIFQTNASHQAPAALDAANTTDATSRLPACAGSPSNDKPSTNNQ